MMQYGKSSLSNEDASFANFLFLSIIVFLKNNIFDDLSKMAIYIYQYQKRKRLLNSNVYIYIYNILQGWTPISITR